MTRSRLLPLAALVLLLLALTLPALTARAGSAGDSRPPAGAVRATLVRVIDGDTIDVLISDQVERVRYIGIDTPERSQPGYAAATEANRALVESGPLYLVKDKSERDRTQSARLLRYVYMADGRLVEQELVAGGWAAPVEYPPDVRFARTFRQLAVQAAKRGLGFWAPTPPQPDGAMPYGLTTGPARVRKGPGTGFAINTNVAKDTPLTVFGRTPAGDWLQVRTPTRAGGWISAGLVRLNVPVDQVTVASDIPPWAAQPKAPAVRSAPAVVVPAAPQPAPAIVQPAGNCDPSYPDVCIPSPPPDLDCGEISFRRFRVIGADPHRFDGDHDGVGCESG